MNKHVENLLDNATEIENVLRANGFPGHAEALHGYAMQVRQHDEKSKKPIVPIDQLEIGDVVCLTGEEFTNYPQMTVSNVTDHEVKFYRPFVHTNDFKCTSGVLCYVGISEFGVFRQQKNLNYYLISRRETPLR